jgi:adenylate cyclase class 2
LRIRTIHGPDDTRSLLIYKGARVDEASGSKPEHETRVDDPEAVHAMLRGLGYVLAIAFEKRCRNYEFEAHGRRMLTTLVRVPEIDGTFLEVETLVDEDQVQAALADVRGVLAELGISEDDLTTELYSDAVAAQRAPDPGHTKAPRLSARERRGAAVGRTAGRLRLRRVLLAVRRG